MEIYQEPKITSPLPISRSFNLTDDDVRRRPFVSELALRLAGVRRVNDDVGHQILAKNTPQKDVEFKGLAIPYLHADSKNRQVTEWTIRRDIPDYEKNGAGELKEKRKYMKPPGAKNQIYVPPMMPAELLKNANSILVITEGEFKALSLAEAATNDFTSEKWSFVPVGLSGVENFKTKRKGETPHGERQISEPIADFDSLALEGRRVGICFDSDLTDKPAVKAARSRLNRFLKEKGAKVFYINFPQTYGEVSTKGVDDYLQMLEQTHGRERAIDSFLKLLDSSQKPQSKASPMAENFELVENDPARVAGIYYSDTKTGENFRVCSPVKIVAETSTREGSGHGRLLEWCDKQNRRHRWAMPMTFLQSEGPKVAGYLADYGLDILPSRRYHEKLAFYIATAATDKILVSTDKIGLHGECFVLPDRTFGESEFEVVYQSEGLGFNKFAVAGTLSEWQANISKYCRNNSRLLFAASCSFAAPLLPIVQMRGGGFHLRGATSTGKTTALFVGGSICGGDAEHGFLQTWKATANGLEIFAAGHNHSCLFLDEISECESREIGNIAYMLGNGRGKLRGNKAMQSRQSLTWNLIFLSTGEQRLVDKITEAGGTIKGGQEVRLCDIEADTGKYGLFEDLHDIPSGQMLSDHLSAASCLYYGTALRSYLKWLMESDFTEIRETWNEFKDSFIGEVLPNRGKQPAEVTRAAARFALAAFGGELATKAEVTKWSEGEATAAVKKLFRQWLAGREGGGGSDIERGIRQVRDYILNYEQSRFEKLWSNEESRVIERVGFVRKNDAQKENEYLIFPNDFKKICKGSNASTIANEMKERGIVQPDKAGNSTKVVKIGGKPFRCYVITEKIFTFDETEETKAANA